MVVATTARIGHANGGFSAVGTVAMLNPSADAMRVPAGAGQMRRSVGAGGGRLPGDLRHLDERGSMRLDIYKDDRLGASFVYGAAPRYFGHEGREIEALIAATPVVYNLWTQEAHPEPASERADWWAARIISAPLARAGFVLRPVWGRVEPTMRRCIVVREHL